MLAKEHLIPTTATESNTYQLQGLTGSSPVTTPPPGDVPGSKGRNIGEWWFLAGDPAVVPWESEDVRKAKKKKKKKPSMRSIRLDLIQFY